MKDVVLKSTLIYKMLEIVDRQVIDF